jgi:hypothetical protein
MIARGANSVDPGLNFLAPLSAIEEAKQDFQPLRQLLWRVKFGATALSHEQHVTSGDAHRRLREFVPRLFEVGPRYLCAGPMIGVDERHFGTFPYK